MPGTPVRDLAGHPTGSPATQLVATLTELAEAFDAVGEAVSQHDLDALNRANARAEDLAGRAGALTAGLDKLDRMLVDPVALEGVRARLAAASRRNTFLIERAWSVDASTIRLLVSLGRSTQEGPTSVYGAPAPQAWMDREA